MDRRKFIVNSAAAMSLPGLTTKVAAAPSQKVSRPQQTDKTPKRFNFLFITADDMDWSMPGFMGNSVIITPNLDALAKRSHRFTSNRTVVPICQPAREAMMTGMLPHHSGGTGFTPINNDTPTFTTILQDQGYFTAGIHKLQHMQPPGCFPWDFQRGGMNGNPLTWDDRNPVLIADVVEEAMGAARTAGKPFYINCNITDPHRPFYGSPEAAKQDHNQTGDYKIPHEIKPEDVTIPPHLEDLPDVRIELAQYWNSVQRLDIAIGNILERLSKSPEADNTLIVFSSDHGMPFPFAKSTCYDSGTRVPVVMCWPGMSAPNSYDALTMNIDLLPTVLDILSVEIPSSVDGKSWMPLIDGSVNAFHEYSFTYMNTGYDGLSYPMRAIQDHRYLMIFSPWSDGHFALKKIDSMAGLTFKATARAGRSNRRIAARAHQYIFGTLLALYDLKTDPGERVNIVDRPDMRDRVSVMKRALLENMRSTNDPELSNFELYLRHVQPIVLQRPRRHQHYNWVEGPVD